MGDLLTLSRGTLRFLRFVPSGILAIVVYALGHNGVGVVKKWCYDSTVSRGHIPTSDDKMGAIVYVCIVDRSNRMLVILKYPRL